MAEVAFEECDPDVRIQLGRHLLLGMFLRLIRAERSKDARQKREQKLLPGYSHIPIRIRISEKKRKPVDDATYTDIRAYVRLLAKSQREKNQSDAKRAEAQQLLDLMSKYNRKTEGITVKEVMVLEGRT